MADDTTGHGPVEPLHPRIRERRAQVEDDTLRRRNRKLIAIGCLILAAMLERRAVLASVTAIEGNASAAVQALYHVARCVEHVHAADECADFTLRSVVEEHIETCEFANCNSGGLAGSGTDSTEFNFTDSRIRRRPCRIWHRVQLHGLAN